MDLMSLTAVELGKKIQAKEVTVEEAVKAAIASIKAKEEKINSFVTIDEEGALKKAAEVQAKIDTGELKGALAGVPVAIKDNMCTEGLLTTCSSKILYNFIPTYTAEAVKRLEDAGCQILYGLGDYKVHSKLCLITKKKGDGFEYITQIGTGNYNEKTSRLYTDLSLITANQEIGADASRVFMALQRGETVSDGDVKHLLVAPKCLQNKIVDMIDEQIANKNAGKPAYIGVKINSLTDKVLIDKLIDASQAGVKVELIVRGICCVKPQVEGATENITVISVVGRYLEHSRIYRFGVGDDEKIYIASADFMTRNTVRRVEVATPVYDAHAKDKIRHIFDTIMTDDEKGKELCADGEYVDRKINSTPIDSQEQFFEEAYKNADKSADNQ